MRKSFANLFSDVQDPALKRLAVVAPGYIFKSRSDSTVHKYLNGFHFWSSWAKEFKEISLLPAKHIYVALFIVSSLQQNTSIGRITDKIFGINWVHLSLGMVSPYSSSMVKNLLETSKRLLEKAKATKEPITPDHLAALVKKFGSAKASLKDLRLLAICLIGYAGFLRFKELSNIKRKDIVFYYAYAKIFIEKSKTDVFREGKWVLIAKAGNYTCPVSMLLRYIQKAKITYSHNNYIFRSLICYKSSIDLKAILGLCPTQDQERLFWKRCQKLDLTPSFLDCIVLDQEVQHRRLMPVFPIDWSSATEDGVQKMQRMAILRMILKHYCQYHYH